jgi:hypothetical protein
MKFKKPCLDCGQLSYGNRCPTHQQIIDSKAELRRAQIKRATNQYGSGYARRAKEIRETAITCHLCGEGARYNDPWQADHIIASSDGTTGELKPAHGSCNRKRSNKPL